LDKEAFEEILLARPTIADEVSHILAVRTAQLDSAAQDIGVAAQRDLSQSRGEILATIRRFFSLNI
jgi:CRP-like cAMP-binding protein